MKHILITGGAGFIGSNLIKKLLENPNIKVTCVDNFDPFYNPQVKKNNIKPFLKKRNFTFVKVDIRDFAKLKTKLKNHYDVIIHLAAKVGVKPSLQNPVMYTEVNVNGTQNMLELAIRLKCKKFIFASSSSIYGINQNVPWIEKDNNLLPISPYAATKISGELLGRVYSSLYKIRFIGLRFFTVYGPGQRPDLVIHKFVKLILEGKPITLYGGGKTKRDYTYVDDIVSGIISSLDYSDSQYEIINLGNNKPVELRELIRLIEEVLGKKAKINKLPEQLGDVPVTFANISKARKLLNYKPRIVMKDGLQKFVDWYKDQENS